MWKAAGIAIALIAVWLYEMNLKRSAPASAQAATTAGPPQPEIRRLGAPVMPLPPLALLGPPDAEASACNFHAVGGYMPNVSSSPTTTASGVAISSLATISQGNTIFGRPPAIESVSLLPVSSQVFAIWPMTTPADWYLIGPSQTSIGNYWWGNSKLGIRTNVSPNGLAAFGGEIL